MSSSQLDALLLELHQQLSAKTEIDESTQKLLRQVSEDIAPYLDEKEAQESESTSVDAELGSDSLKKMAVEFEADHPRLARTVNELADSLAKIGI